MLKTANTSVPSSRGGQGKPRCPGMRALTNFEIHKAAYPPTLVICCLPSHQSSSNSTRLQRPSGRTNLASTYLLKLPRTSSLVALASTPALTTYTGPHRQTGHHHLGLTWPLAPPAAATSPSKDFYPSEAATNLDNHNARPTTIAAPSLPRPSTEPSASSSAEARLGTSFQSLISSTAVLVNPSYHQSMLDSKSAC